MAQTHTRPFRGGIHDRLPTHALPILALIGANVIWGGSAAASKAVLPAIPPLTMASARVGLALVVLLVITLWRGERVATGRTPMLLGVTGVALFCACQNMGLVFTDAATTALIGAAIPVLTIGLAVPLLGERLRRARLAGFLLSMAGVAVIMAGASGGAGGVVTPGGLLPLASAVSFALYNVVGRMAFNRSNSLGLVAGSTRYGLLVLLPGTALELATTSVEAPGARQLLLLAYLGVGCSAVAFTLCGYGLSHIDAGHGSVFGNLKPVVGIALAATLLGEPVSASHLGGGALVLFGIGMTMRSSRRSGTPSRASVRPWRIGRYDGFGACRSWPRPLRADRS